MELLENEAAVLAEGDAGPPRRVVLIPTNIIGISAVGVKPVIEASASVEYRPGHCVPSRKLMAALPRAAMLFSGRLPVARGGVDMRRSSGPRVPDARRLHAAGADLER
jgi:hypothetical protein